MPLGSLRLYVHVPFCVRKCAYCAFYSEPYRARNAALFIDQVMTEISVRAGRIGAARVASVYIGGGTPSVLSQEQLGAVLDCVRRCFSVVAGAEITVEANPESALRSDFLAGLPDLGVNRLSLGVQSFRDDMLRLLGRLHSGREAELAFGAARAAGLTNIGLDLIWGLPGQTVAAWLEDLRRAVALGPEHLSCYGLSLEEGTPLAARAVRGELALPDEDESVGMYLDGSEFLESRGYAHYEISNYALPGRESRHNAGYWAQDDYLGLGPAAVSSWGARRWTNPADLAEYARCVEAGCPEMNVEKLSARIHGRELVMLSLRTSGGLNLERFKAQTGQDFLQYTRPFVEQLCSRGLARLRSGHLQLTRRGMLLGNSVIGMLLDLLDDMPEHMEYS